ncbi:hypothetical protein [Streptomyces sp. IMTB 2501]|uniref:hypothetical protein n=1 Tax=Streptomyces sp. IMTB 2501 TaxID=1776340 RepID=UPI002116C04A|nr:hypothetical protein [Streptomyces sp. IMTB 2501]
MTTPWPRTEWIINRDPNAPRPGHGLLVGGGPSFLNFDQALSAFLHQRPHDSNANRSDLWRIVQPQRAGWFPISDQPVTFHPDHRAHATRWETRTRITPEPTVIAWDVTPCAAPPGSSPRTAFSPSMHATPTPPRH